MRENLFAHTPPGPNPPYISINREEDGLISIAVRGEYQPAIHSENHLTPPHQDYAALLITDEVAMDLVSKLFSKLFFNRFTPNA